MGGGTLSKFGARTEKGVERDLLEIWERPARF